MKTGSIAQHATWLFTLGALSCGASPSADGPVEPLSTAVSTVGAPPATSEPGVGATPAVSTTDPKPTSPFVAVATLPSEQRLYPVEGAMLAVAVTPTEDFKLAMGLIDGDRYVEKPELAMQTVWSFIVDIRGSWPQGLDMLMTGTTGRTGIAEHWILTADGGWKIRAARQGSFFAGIAEIGGSTIGLEASVMGFHKPEIKTLRGPKVSRTFAPVTKECMKTFEGEGNQFFVPKSQVNARSFGATRAGTILAVGYGACSEATFVEIFAPSSATSRIVPLPITTEKKADGDGRVVRGAGHDDAWILDREVAYFDGKDIRALPALPHGVAAQGAATSDGLFVLTAETSEWDRTQNKHVVTDAPRLFRTDGKSWTAVPLDPTVGAPTSIVTDSTGTVWMTAGTVLYRTKKSEAERSIALGAANAPGAAKRQPTSIRKPPRPPGPLCPSNLVVLYGFTKVTPEDYDFPATRKAVKGHHEFSKTRFVVAKDNGQKFFTAIVPDVATGRNLVKLIEKEVAGSKPQLLCAEPEIVREMKIDLGTGNVVK